MGASKGEEEVPMVISWRRENSGRAEQVGLRFISACSGVRKVCLVILREKSFSRWGDNVLLINV